MPFVQAGLVQAMLALAEKTPAADVVVLQTEFGIQPMHAVYARSCLPAVEQALTSDDHSLHTLLGRLSLVSIGDEIVRREDRYGLSAFNANTPDDWQRAIALASADNGAPGT
jgi:molybdopterin-guanine dinucleotide biosynthesis protein A